MGYPFKINIETKNGTKLSFYSSSFADSTSGYSAISASNMMDSINTLGRVQFTQSIEEPAATLSGVYTTAGATGGATYLSASCSHPNTGSITFTDKENGDNGGLDRYTFWGTKVCSVLGLPEGIPIYTETFKLSDSESNPDNYLSGDVISDGITIKESFKMSNQARMRSNLVFDDVFGEGLIQWVSGSGIKMYMGYNDQKDKYEIKSPNISGSKQITFGHSGYLSSSYGAGNEATIGHSNGGYIGIRPGSTNYGLIIRKTDATDWANFRCQNGYLSIQHNEYNTAKGLFVREYGSVQRVGINENDPDVTLHVDGTISGSLLRSAGDVVAYYSSDERLKNNIKTINKPIYKLKKLKGVEYEWNDLQDTYPSGSLDSGIIAQDVQKVLPQIVKERNDGYLGVRQERLVGLLIEGIKDQQKQIDELKLQIKEIKHGSS